MGKLSSLAVGFALLTPLCWPAHAAQRQKVVPVDGTPYQAELLSIDAHWKIRLQRPDDGNQPTEQVLPAGDMVSWGQPVEAVQRAHFFLVDGGLLVAQPAESDKSTLNVESPTFGKLSLPMELLRGIVFQPPADAQRRDALVQRLWKRSQRSPDTDRLLLNNGDELSGTILSIGRDEVLLETDGQPIKVETSRVDALAFSSLLAARSDPHEALHALVGLRDGSLLKASQLVLDGARVQLTPAVIAADGATPPWSTDSSAVVFLQPLGGKATYLSDLKAESYRHIPYLTVSWPYHADLNVSGTRLRHGGRLYVKGIGMHSASRVTYRLEKPYRRFEAALGIDDLTSGRGSVVFRVFLDGKLKYTSPVVRGRMDLVPVSIDVAGGKQLSLIVDFAERGDELDHANWLDARLVE